MFLKMELSDKNQAPFKDGLLLNPSAQNQNFLPAVKGLSNNKVHGNQSSIDAIVKKYDPDIESMKGPLFFILACNSNKPL